MLKIQKVTRTLKKGEDRRKGVRGGLGEAGAGAGQEQSGDPGWSPRQNGELVPILGGTEGALGLVSQERDSWVAGDG